MIGLPAAPVAAQVTTAPVETASYTRTRDRDPDGRVVGPVRVNWWNDAVFYQVFVRSFQDASEPSLGRIANDGIGDLRGLIKRLDYLNDGDPGTTDDLGITGLWLMPIHPSPSYHGYDITDYTGVNPDYGTLDDLSELVAQCHARGIKVILDLVLNHTSSRHPWFVESLDPASAKRSWYIWRESDPAYAGPWNQRVWHRSPKRPRPGVKNEIGENAGGWYYGLFGADMPDLDFTNRAVSEEVQRVVQFWLRPPPDGPGVDGFRLDAIRHLIERGRQQDNTPETHRWLEAFYVSYKSARADALAVGEVWASTEVAASYVGDQMDMTFEFDLARAMIESARTGDASHVIRAQEAALRAYPPNQYARFLSNHDQERVASTLAHDPGALRVAAAMLMLGPGVPFIYYAEEVGQPGTKPDPNLRTPMPWTAAPSQPGGFSTAAPWRSPAAAPAGTNVQEQKNDPTSLLSFYRTLIRVRSMTPSLAYGAYAHVRCDNPAIYAFWRESPKPSDGTIDAVLVVINLSSSRIESARLWIGATRFSSEAVIRGSDMLNAGTTCEFRHDSVSGKFVLEQTGIAPHAVSIYRLRSAER